MNDLDDYSLYDLIGLSAEQAIKCQNNDGSMPAGKNGLYADPETPVKTTGFWLITYTHQYKYTDNDIFRKAAESAIKYLCSEEARPEGYTFIHRRAEKKDSCNGLMGQAFSIESLAYTGELLNKRELLNLASEVFLYHPFDDELGLWKRREINGNVLPFDRTFNHQLWFAAAGGLISPYNEKIREQVEIFIDNLPNLIDLEPNGLVRHPLRPSFSPQKLLSLLGDSHRRNLIINEILHRMPLTQRDERLYEKAIGYQSVNLYALALLRHMFPEHSVWDHDVIFRPIRYIYSQEYEEKIKDNRKSFVNIATGFENALALEKFQEDPKTVEQWVNLQLIHSFDSDSFLMNKNAADPQTQAANIYRACRLTNYDLSMCEKTNL